MTAVDIADINEGQRHRNDMGDIKSLAESMTEVGLLHPVVLTPDHRLIAGGRRLAAARSLGWVEIPATIVSNVTEADTILQAELDENTHRKDFTPTEAVRHKQSREALLAPLAKARMSEGGKGGQVANPSPKVHVREAAARGTGYSSTTLRKVETVQAIVSDPETPEPVRAVARKSVAEMEKTGKVDAAHKRAMKAKAEAEYAAVMNLAIGDDKETEARLRLRAGLAADISRASKGVLAWNPTEVGQRADPSQLDSLDSLARRFTEFAAKARAAAPKNLRVLSGGK